jgi:hypothetical protein
VEDVPVERLQGGRPDENKRKVEDEEVKEKDTQDKTTIALRKLTLCITRI